MKLEPVTKIDKRNKTTLKKFNDEVIPAICDVIVILSIYGQFMSNLEAGFGSHSL